MDTPGGGQDGPVPMIVDSKVLPGGHRERRCKACGATARTLEDCACRECTRLAPRIASGGPSGRYELADLPAQSTTEKREGRAGCERERCGNAGAVRTARGELVCLRCLGELAAHANDPGA